MQLSQCAPWVHSAVLHTTVLHSQVRKNATEVWQLSNLAAQSILLAQSARLAVSRKDTTAPRVHVGADKS